MKVRPIWSRTTHAFQKGSRFVVKRFLGGKPIVAYVSGYLGFNNLGDEALYLATQRLFEEVAVLHYDSSRTLRAVCGVLPAFKSGIFAGGTLINRLPVYFQEARDFQERFENLFIFGTGVANPAFWRNRAGYCDLGKEWQSVLKQCRCVGVRGPLSAQTLAELGVPNVEVVGDPVLALALPGVTEGYQPNSIGLNVGQANKDLWGNEQTVWDEFLKLAKLAKAAGWTVEWFVVRPEDSRITKQIAEASQTGGVIHEIFHDTDAYLERVRKVGVFAGIKLHATALATCAYVPSIMLEYQPKCRDYMLSIGQGDRIVRTDAFTGPAVWEMVQDLQANRKERAETLARGVKKLKDFQRERADEVIEEIRRLAS